MQAPALVAQLQQQQLARGLPPLTPQQLAHLVHLRQQQQQQPAPAPLPPAAATAAAAVAAPQPSQPAVAAAQPGQPAGISQSERALKDGDHDHRSARDRAPASAPTDRSLPTRFRPLTATGAAAAVEGPSDHRLAPSLDSLERLADAYARLQHIERRADWTLARSAHELAELVGASLAPTKGGQPVRTHTLLLL